MSRFSSNYNKEVNEKIGELSQSVSLQSNPTAFGEIILPSDFPALPCGIYRDWDGVIKHNMDFNPYKSGTVLYVDKTIGSDTTGDGSTGSPFKTIAKAITTALSGANPAYVIRARNTRYNRDEVFPATAPNISGKTIAIIPDTPTNRIAITTHQTGLTWTADGTNTFKTTRTNTYGVYDLRRKDVYGTPIPFKSMKTIAECQATPYSWYTDGTTVWVRTGDGIAPDDTNFIISVSVTATATISNGGKLYLENCDFISGLPNDALSISGDTTTKTGELCANNCKFIGGNVRNDGVYGNGFAGVNLKRTYLFNCLTAYACRDGFNHHFGGIPAINAREYLVLEYGCTSYNNGLNDTVNGNNNCFTCHESVNIIRINNVGFNSTGPILADVTGCYSICYDCNMRGNFSTSGAFQFANSGMTTGKAIMINCGADSGGIGDDITGDVDIKINNVKAKKISTVLKVTYI